MRTNRHFSCRLCLLGVFLLSSMAGQSQSNQEAWVRRYNASEAGSRDNARKVVADPDGNIVVAGDTDDGFTGADFLIIKYSGEGVPLWTNRYGGSANGDDRVYALGVDQSGNVFVTGFRLVTQSAVMIMRHSLIRRRACRSGPTTTTGRRTAQT